MPDRLTRFKEVLASLEGSADIADVSTRRAWSWFDTHKIEVLELVELKGNTVAEEFLGTRQGSISGWRTNRGLSDSLAKSKRKSMARRKELEGCLRRLMHDKADLQRQQGRKWLDAHREDMEIALSFGIDHGKLISSLGILDGVFKSWCKDREIIMPRGRGRHTPNPRELAERMLDGLKKSMPILGDKVFAWLDEHKVMVVAVMDELGGKAMAEALSIDVQVLYDWRRGGFGDQRVEPTQADRDRVEPTQADRDRVEPTQADRDRVEPSPDQAPKVWRVPLQTVRSREDLDRELAAAKGLAVVEVALRQVREVALNTRDLLEEVADAVRR